MFILFIWASIAGMLVNGIFNVIITTLERRFRLQSSQTGLIAVSYDIGYWIVCLFVTFYANRGHRPRILGVGSIFLAIGCIIFAIPHFTTGVYEYDDSISRKLGVNQSAIVDRCPTFEL